MSVDGVARLGWTRSPAPALQDKGLVGAAPRPGRLRRRRAQTFLAGVLSTYTGEHPRARDGLRAVGGGIRRRSGTGEVPQPADRVRHKLDQPLRPDAVIAGRTFSSAMCCASCWSGGAPTASTQLPARTRGWWRRQQGRGHVRATCFDRGAAVHCRVHCRERRVVAVLTWRTTWGRTWGIERES